MTLPVHWVNGEQGASIPATDRGFAYGDGVFETFRCLAGKPMLWTYHLQRLERGLDTLGIDCERDRLSACLRQGFEFLTTREVAHAAGRLVVSRGPGERGYRGDAGPATIVLGFSPIADWRQPLPPLEVVLCHSPLSTNARLAGIKHCNRLDQVMAARELRERSAAAGLQLNDRGELVCAVSANLFLVSGGEMLTPSISDSGIEGTVRRLILDTLAPALDLQVRETVLRPDDITAASEMFLTSALDGIRSVSRCEAVSFTSSECGDTLRREFYRWSESHE